MIGEFLVNPRRAPRAPARCHAAVQLTDGAWEAPIADVGPGGCQLVVPRAIAPGTRVRVALRGDGVAEPLVVAGTVAWSANAAPWRAGIAFAEGALAASTRWYQQLLAAHPELGWARQMPSHLPMDAMLYLSRPPKYLVDFSADEASVLRHVASGVTVGELRHGLRDRGDGVTRAIFSLLARQHLTLSRGASVHPTAWRPILNELEATFAARALPPTLPRALAAAPRPSAAAAAPARAPAAPRPASAPRAGVYPESRAALRRLDAGGAWVDEPAVAHRRRSFEAQGALERAMTELAAGRRDTAVTLLRRAAALAPGDVEIGRTLAELTFRQGAEG